MTPRLSSLLVAAALVGSLGSLSACSTTGPAADRASDPGARSDPSASPGPGTGEVPTPEPGRVSMAAVDLVRVEVTGGLCAPGACGSTTVIHGDGSWEVTDASGTRDGALSFEDLNEVIRLATMTDPKAYLKDAKSCASWADGQDVALTYAPITSGSTGGSGGGPVTVSSCDYDLSKSRLLRFVEKATAA